MDRILALWIALSLGVFPWIALGVGVGLSEDNDQHVFIRLEDSFLSPVSAPLPHVGNSILADLDRMEITLVEDGMATKTFKILSKGRRGTPWETPGGSYSIRSKEKTHFSTLGHVFMPWSMQFYGNFFIHGWPYDLDGNDVPKGYSGGCIRLSTPDAEEVYRFVDRGTPVVVTTVAAPSRTGAYYVSGGEAPPTVTGSSFMVFDLDRAQVLWRRSDTQQFSDALTAKFLATLVSLEHMNQYASRDVERQAFTDTWLTRRGSFPAKDLIAPMLYAKDTSIEELLARAHGKREFMRGMKDKMSALGMDGTTLNDLGGASTTNVTTVSDMAKLLRALDQSKPYVLGLTASSVVALPDADGMQPVVVTNDNALAEGPYAKKGGLVDQGHGDGMVILEIPIHGQAPRRIALVIAGSHNVNDDIASMSGYVADALRYFPDHDEQVIAEPSVSLFAKLRMIWNRKRISEMLLGIEHAPDAAHALMSRL